MSRETFETHRFQTKTLAVIEHANAIIGEYEANGFVLTLRQLFYQLVSRSLIANKQATRSSGAPLRTRVGRG